MMTNSQAESETIEVASKSAQESSETVDGSVAALNYLWADAYLFEDSTDVRFMSVDLFYKRLAAFEDLGMGVDAGLFFIERGETKYTGHRYGGSLYYKNFSLRLGLNEYEDFSEFVPTLTYADSYKNNNYTLEYTQQNALFYTFSLPSYEKRIIADHFSASDYIAYGDSQQLWANISVDFYSNDDTEITAQFDWIFYHDTVWQPKFTYNFALEGWYTSHSKQHNDFYSPTFADATLLRFDPQYLFSNSFGVRGRLGFGFSVMDEAVPYKYGLWFFGKPAKSFDYSIGCLESNAARIGFAKGYYYRECTAHLGYSW